MKYGSSSTDLDKSINNITHLSQTISSLSNDSSYYFALAANNANGSGKFSDITEVKPSQNIAKLDLSVDKVTFNQSVQVDLLNNTNKTPIIANKPGVLRIFIKSNSFAQHQKVDIRLGGSSNGVKLKSIVKEVILSDATFTTSDSSNEALFFDINTPQWMAKGTSFYVEIDPYNIIKESDETNNRYPASSEISFGFEDAHKMRIKLIPVLTSVGSVKSSITQELVDGAREYMKSIYPLHLVEVSVGDELNAHTRTPKNNSIEWSNILDDIVALKDRELSGDATLKDVYYYGIIDRYADDIAGLTGLAYTNPIEYFDEYPSWEPALVGMGRIDEVSMQSFYETLAHEIGHNHGRLHVDNQDEQNDNCGVPENIDTNYIYNSSNLEFGRIGKTGYNNVINKLYEKSYYHDMMTYCSRIWISDYTYKAIYEFERKLDTLYNRTNNLNARSIAVQESRTMGQMIVGRVSRDKNADDSYAITKKYSILRSDKISQADTQFYVEVVLENTQHFKIPLFITSLDHSDLKTFKFFIPSQSAVKSMIIYDRNSTGKRGQIVSQLI